jgi:hypothetical protein
MVSKLKKYSPKDIRPNLRAGLIPTAGISLDGQISGDLVGLLAKIKIQQPKKKKNAKSK